jgi:5-methylcytosine-specific restriction endonuclease McrA
MCPAHYARWRTHGDAGDTAIRQYKAPVVDGEKPCGDCGSWFPLTSYNTNSHKTGPKSMCRECERLRNVAWRESNPTYWQEWQKANPQLVRDISNRRRAAKFSREFEKIDRDLVFERDAYECKLCSKPLDMTAKFPHPLSPTLDHSVPLNKGGHHLYVNLQAAHFRCNTAKGDRVV